MSAIAFGDLGDIAPALILEHMNDPRVGVHLPLLTHAWNLDDVAAFLAAKAACWDRDGLGHWAILRDGTYAGWGGFQREGDDWDFGLVLRAEDFGIGPAVLRKALAFARGDARIGHVTFLLAPSRLHLAALARIGAEPLGTVSYGGVEFLKFRLAASGEIPDQTPII